MAGALRLSLAQLEELRGSALLPPPVDESSQATLRRGELCSCLLRQPPAAPVRLKVQVRVALEMAAATGVLKDLPLNRLAWFERALDTALTAAGVTIPIDRPLSPQLQQSWRRSPGA